MKEYDIIMKKNFLKKKRGNQMPSISLLEKYAKLAVVVGANVQKDQVVIVRSSTETKELARLIAKEAYLVGAKEVVVTWGDEYVGRYAYEYQSIETLQEVPQWIIDRTKFYMEVGACVISITSPIPGLNAGVDPMKMQKAGIAMSKALSFYQEFMMANKTQWNIVAAPNAVWAKKVFENLPEEEAVESLWNAILSACRVREDNDPVEEWKQHNQTLSKHNKVLNDFQFKTLFFKNSLGTDISIDLVEDHIWAGGAEKAGNGVVFNPNIPTEETFTMPHKYGVNGKVVATKPLNYQGNLIEDFYLEFKEGKVVAHGARKEESTLLNLLNFDEGSRYIGEIALISHDSPISNSNILFLNTLFDENASCHMALGRAYPMNVKNGNDLSKEELEKIGYNDSMSHSDFMFGSACMEIIGKTKDGKEIQIFKNGNFVI